MHRLLTLGLVSTLIGGGFTGAIVSPASADSGCPTAVTPSQDGVVYQIATDEHLQWVRASGSASAAYKLTADISMAGCTWTSGLAAGANFTGTFDGNGKTISFLTVARGTGSGDSNGGLFNVLAAGNVVDLTLASPTISSHQFAGALAGKVTGGTISNLTVTSPTITTSNNSGSGYAGGAFGEITGGTVSVIEVIDGTVTSGSANAAGGVAAVAAVALNDVSSSARVEGLALLGGLVGQLNVSGSITGGEFKSPGIVGNAGGTSTVVGGAVGVALNGTSLTRVTGSGLVQGGSYVGGLVSEAANNVGITQSSSSSTVTSAGAYAGGLLGYESGTGGSISESFFNGSVTATQTVGGIAGVFRSTMSNSYSTGSAEATSATGQAGGLVGASISSTIEKSFAAGPVIAPAGASNVGGLIGQASGGSAPGSVWDTQTTGQSSSVGFGALGFTTQQLRDFVLFDADNLNWDITDGISGGGVGGTVWSICSGVTPAYPFLTWQGLSGTCLPTMAYNGNGNTGGTAPSDPTTPYASGETVTVLGNSGTLTKTSNTFYGWNTKANGTGTFYSEGNTFTITAPRMLFAQWTTGQVITYGANGGSGTAAPTLGATSSSVTLSSGSDLTRAGYTLAGWNTATNGSGTAYTLSEAISMPAGGLTLHAQWTATSQTITYDANGGTGVVADTTGSTDSTVTLATGASLTRTGFSLTAWNSTADGSGTTYTLGASIPMPASNLTLYEQWTASGGGGGGGGSSSTGSDVSPPPSSPSATQLPSLDFVAPPTATTAGQEWVTVGGSRVPVAVQANSRNDGIDVRATGWQLSLEGRGPTGQPLPLGANAVLRVIPGAGLETRGTGFLPGSAVHIYIASEPTLLGTLTVNTSGAFSATVPVPVGLTVGSHLAQVNGISPDARVRSVSIGVEVVRSAQVRTLSSRVLFAYESAVLTAKAKKSLRALVRQARSSSSAQSVVVGVLRAPGASSTDRVLAQKRAEVVGAYLRESGLKGPIKTIVRKQAVQNRPSSRRAEVTVRLNR